MGNRSSSSSGSASGSGGASGSSGGYPAEYRQASLRGAGRLSSSSTTEGRSGGSRSTRGSSGSGSVSTPSGRSPDQTTCPQCQRVLLIPPNAPLFRCPCGVLFRTESLHGRGAGRARVGGGGAMLMGSGGSSLSSLLLGTAGANGAAQRAVLCRRCRRLSVVPASRSPDEVTICRCGAPALPLNDMVMSLLAEGELGLIGGGRRGGAFGGEMEGASRDLIEMLPTCKFSKAAHQHQMLQQQQQHQQQPLKEQEQEAGAAAAATAATATEAAAGEGPKKEETAPVGQAAEAPEGAAVLAAPVAVVEGKELPVEEAAATATAPASSDGTEEAGATSCCAAAAAAAIAAVAVAEAASPPNNTKQEEEAEEDEVGSEHGDDLSCRVCFEDYEDGDEQRVLPCFHRFHVACIDEWLARKKLCPLCNTSIDVILSPPDQLLASSSAAQGTTATA